EPREPRERAIEIEEGCQRAHGERREDEAEQQGPEREATLPAMRERERRQDDAGDRERQRAARDQLAQQRPRRRDSPRGPRAGRQGLPTPHRGPTPGGR